MFILLLTIHDVSMAVYVRLYDPDNRTGFMGHLCGSLAGLTVGLFVLDNRQGTTFNSILGAERMFLFMFGIIFKSSKE